MVEDKGGILIDLDFNDAEFVVRKHPDGMYTIDVVEDRLLVNEEQFKQIVQAFIGLDQDLRLDRMEAPAEKELIAHG